MTWWAGLGLVVLAMLRHEWMLRRHRKALASHVEALTVHENRLNSSGVRLLVLEAKR